MMEKISRQNGPYRRIINSIVRKFAMIVVVVVAFSIVLSASSAASATVQQENQTGNATPYGASSEQFAVKQGSNCYTVTPLGDGSDNVASFYDYRGAEHGYSSHGTNDLQIKDSSQFFFYRGNGGLNLVMLHGRWAGNVSPGGGAVTLELRGLPSTGGWTIKDDGYPTTTDSLTANKSMATASWTWSGGRSDGGVYQAAPSAWNSRIQIVPHFNREAAKYPDPDWEGRESENQVQRWIVRSGDGTAHALDLSQQVVIEPGACDSQNGTTDTSDHEPEPTTQTHTSTSEETTTETAAAESTTRDTPEETAAAGPGFGTGLTLLALAIALIGILRRRY